MARANPKSPRRRKKASPAVRSRGGRPSLEASRRLADRILDAATRRFLAEGYGATSIEEVVRLAGVSKRTFYSRFEDKAALFGAVLQRIVEGLRPPAEFPLIQGRNLAAILQGLAELILRAALSPQAIAVHRLIIGESARFPALAAAVNRNGATEEGVSLIASLLEREARAGNITVDDPHFAASQFLHMVITVPQRHAMGLERPMTEAQLRQWPRKVVALFLEGVMLRVQRG